MQLRIIVYASVQSKNTRLVHILVMLISPRPTGKGQIAKTRQHELLQVVMQSHVIFNYIAFCLV